MKRIRLGHKTGKRVRIRHLIQENILVLQPYTATGRLDAFIGRRQRPKLIFRIGSVAQQAQRLLLAAVQAGQHDLLEFSVVGMSKESHGDGRCAAFLLLRRFVQFGGL